MAELSSFKAIVRGRVTGIGFRAFTGKQAESLGLTGYVRNIPGERAVEVEAEGDKAGLEALISRLKVGPSPARVSGVEVTWREYSGKYPDFSIRV